MKLEVRSFCGAQLHIFLHLLKNGKRRRFTGLWHVRGRCEGRKNAGGPRPVGLRPTRGIITARHLQQQVDAQTLANVHSQVPPPAARSSAQ